MQGGSTTPSERATGEEQVHSSVRAASQSSLQAANDLRALAMSEVALASRSGLPCAGSISVRELVGAGSGIGLRVEQQLPCRGPRLERVKGVSRVGQRPDAADMDVDGTVTSHRQ